MSKVAVISCENYDYTNVKNAVKKGIDALGGITQFVKPGEKILLKPNVLVGDTADKCSTTNPAVLKAVAELLLQAGITPTYGDSPGFGKPYNACKRAGIVDAAEELGLKFADFENGKEVTYENGKQNKRFFIANAVLDNDGVISLPKLKVHGFQKYTGAVKNQFGCIPGLLKGSFHVKIPSSLEFAKMLIDLNNYIKPRLYVIDGILSMEGNGPRGGNPRATRVILISNDPIAIDATACRLINIDPLLVPTIKFGPDFNAGTHKKEEIELVGDSFESLVVKDFDISKDPVRAYYLNYSVSNFFKNLFVPKPTIDSQKCIKCGICIEVCPVNPKALSWPNGEKQNPPVYNYTKCIRCYCCQELCPESAIYLKKRFRSSKKKK